jgi:hypothetical protein
MKISCLSVLLLAIVTGCGSSKNDGGSGGSAAGGSSGAGGATGGSAGGGATGGSAGIGAAGGSAGAGAAGAGGESACPFQGTWQAVQYACGTDAPQTVPPVVTFTIVISGSNGTFTQVNTAGTNTCTNTASGSATCSGDVTTFGSGVTMCTPDNCLSKSQCGMTAAPIVYTFTQPTATTLTTVTPDTTPLTTCTDQGKSNPVTFYWQKQ